MIGMIVSGGRATLYELQTVYGVEDLYNLAEIIVVDNHNKSVVARANQS